MALRTTSATPTNRSTPRQPAMPLGFVPTGQRVVVREIRGGQKLQYRLRDLGLNLGATIRVVKNDGPGPLILAVKEDSRLALGRGMAHHILVDTNTNTNE